MKLTEIFKKMERSRNVWIVLFSLVVFSIVIRIMFLPVPVFQGDFSIFNAWAEELKFYGFAHFYQNSGCNYLAVYAYILKFSTLIQPTIHSLNSSWSQDQVIGISYKLPCFIFDLLTAYFILLFIFKQTKNKLLGVLGAIFYLYNPVIFHNTYIYGQNNVLLYLPTVAMFYFLTEKKFIYTGASLALLLLVKPTGIIIVPFVLLMFILQNKVNYKAYLKFFLSFYITLQLLILPFSFRLPWNFADTFWTALTTGNGYKLTQMYSYNIWYILTGSNWLPDSITFWGKSYYFWGMLMFAVTYFISLLFLYLYRSRFYLILATVIYFAFFIFPTRVHEGYLLFAFPIFILAMFIYRNYVLGFLYLLTSLVYAYNIWGYWPWELGKYVPMAYGGRGALFSAYVLTLTPLFLICYYIYLNYKTRKNPK